MKYIYIKELTVIRDGEYEKNIYFVKKMFSDEFNCDTYAVGVSEDGKISEIKDFSISFESAKEFTDYLWRQNATGETLFLLGEEFLGR